MAHRLRLICERLRGSLLGLVPKFATDLGSICSLAASVDSKRLAKVQALLARLIVQLDVEEVLVIYEHGQVISPRWAQDGLRVLPGGEMSSFIGQ
jgi:hypothetical protein